jgi:hypothetical protein
MDNYSPHLTPIVIDFLSEACVKIVTCAPHTTHILRVLDLALYWVLKQRRQYQLPFDDDAGTAYFIKKVYHDLRLTMPNANIWSTFRCIGLSYGFVDVVQRVSFNEITLRESDGFRELWDVDFPRGICRAGAEMRDPTGSTDLDKLVCPFFLSVLSTPFGDICLPKIQEKLESGEIPRIVLPSGTFSATIISDHYDSLFMAF